MSSNSSTSPYADILIRANRIYTLQHGLPVQKAIAIQGGIVQAISEEIIGLDAFIGPNTQIIDEPKATVLPSFDDTHTHLIFAALGQFDVPMHDVLDLTERLRRLSERATKTKIGQWINTSTDWQEYNLRERRLPSIQELDRVSTKHPILVRRGGHNAVLNSLAMEMAGVTAATPVPKGGKIGLDENGRLNGLLQDSALGFVFKILPTVTLEERVAGLEAASAAFASSGIGCVRDCFVPIEDIPVLKATYDAGKLHTRVRALISSMGVKDATDMTSLLDKMEVWRSLQNEPWLSIWGVKFFLDGGIEAGATEEPYVSEGCGCPVNVTTFQGRLLWERDALIEVMDLVLRRGWRIGTHAYGDRATRILLDVYQELRKRHPSLEDGCLVMEHGALATEEQRRRAVGLGIPVTIQVPLLHDAAAIQEVYWGKERVSRLFPVKQWIESGANVSAGSDFPVGPYGAMFSLWSMATRQTVAGVRGPEHAITVADGIQLHTSAAVRMLRESDVRGVLIPGRFADMNIWEMDPFECGVDDSTKLATTLYSIIGGKVQSLPIHV